MRGHQGRGEREQGDEEEHHERHPVRDVVFLFRQTGNGGVRDPEPADECETDDVGEEVGLRFERRPEQVSGSFRHREFEDEQRDDDREDPVGERT